MSVPLISFDADQQTSATQKDNPQNDRWHAEEISPRRGPAFTLVVIADGEGSPTAGEIADLAVKIAFAEARLRRDEPLPKLFRHLMHQMNQVVTRQMPGNLVGITLGAVRAGNLLVTQAGSQTRCYRVRGERAAVLLTSDNDSPLGKSDSAPAFPIAQYKLKKGDKLVFCTDGLFGSDLVSIAEIAKIDRYAEIKGAARHLSALAMGRNVSDNVTVAVVAYGFKKRWSPKVLVFDAIGILLAFVMLLGLTFAILRYTRILPRPPDLGIAVLAQGKAVEVEQLQIIYPGKDISASADSPIQLRLKRRESLNSGVTESIPNVDLIFSAGSSANLAAIDVQGFTDPLLGIKNPTNLTEIRMRDGKLLVLSRDARTFYVWLGESADKQAPLIVLQGAGAALGVDLQDGRANAYCLRGSCSLYLGRSTIPLDASSKISLAVDTRSSDSLRSVSLDDADRKSWMALCSTWQLESASASLACQLLLP